MAVDFDKNYPLGNSGYERPHSIVNFMQVPFDNTYSDIVDFSSATAQRNAFLKLNKYAVSYLNYIAKDKAFVFAGNVAQYENYNYLCYQNANYNNKWFYCFITQVEYVTKNSTKIYIETDVWQTWQFQLKYYQCYIERAHISKSDDVIGVNMNGEPIGTDASYETQVNIFDGLNWDTFWLLNAVSFPHSNDMIYGGTGSGDEFDGTYHFVCYNATEISSLIEQFAKHANTGDFGDHRQDIIGITSVPQWVLESAGSAVVDGSTNRIVTGNVTVSKSDTVNINLGTLACGYTPRNKKMCTSLFSGVLVYNQNGLRIPLKPELFSDKSSVTLRLYSKLFDNGIKLAVGGYHSDSREVFDIAYGTNRACGYNANSGTAATLNKVMTCFNGALNIAQAGVNVAKVAPTAPINPLGVASTIGSTVQTVGNEVVNIMTAFDAQSASVGSTTDALALDRRFSQIKLAKFSPTYAECKVIDRYFDVYGYAINSYGQLANWIKTRSRWNYVKTAGAKIQGNCNQKDLVRIKQIFDSGVTIWHSLDYFGEYTENNN